MLLQRSIALIFIGFLVNACVTNTRLDVVIYPSDYYLTEITDDESTIALCTALEEVGYLFDEFGIREYGIEVSYPDGSVQQFVESRSLNPVLITTINRDYDSPYIFSDEEFERLEQEARAFCKVSQQIATDLSYEWPLTGVLFWDWVNGVRGGFHFSEECEITNSYGWGTGSYARQYELIPDQICPAGHVVH